MRDILMYVVDTPHTDVVCHLEEDHQPDTGRSLIVGFLLAFDTFLVKKITFGYY